MQQRVIEWLDRTGQGIPWYQKLQELVTSLWSIFHPKKFLEEVEELREGLTEKDIYKILDAVIDCDYYLKQKIGHLERAGVDYKGAFNAVCSNNDLKYTTSRELVTKWYCEYKMTYRGTAKGEDVIICDSFVDGETFYCLKNKTGKVLKWVGFPTVDLSEFIPKELEKEKKVWNNGVFPRGRGIWQEDIKTKEHYYEVVGTGMAWEVYSDLPLCWDLAESELKKWEEENE